MSGPAPTVDGLTKPFWDAAAKHELAIQRCETCRHYVHFPSASCPQCGALALTFEGVSGEGNVYSFVVTHHTAIPGFADRVPYVVAWIELAEQPGLRVVSDLVDCDPSQVAIGAPVRVWFDDREDGITIPRFRLEQR